MLIVLDSSSALLFVFRHTRLKLSTIQGTWIAKMPTYFPLKCFLGGKFDSWFVTTVAYQFKLDRYESLKKRWIKRIDRRIIRKNFSLPILDLTCSGGLFVFSIERRCDCICYSIHHECTGFFKYREIQYFLQAGVRWHTTSCSSELRARNPIGTNRAAPIPAGAHSVLCSTLGRAVKKSVEYGFQTKDHLEA